MKKKIIIVILVLLLFVTISTIITNNESMNRYTGSWHIVEEYQAGNLIDGESSGLDLTIKQDGTWTIKDEFFGSSSSGKLKKYNGNYCIYYDDFRYMLKRKFDKLVVTAINIQEKSYPEGKLIFEK